MTHTETYPNGEIKGLVHDEHETYINGVADALAEMKIAATVLEGGNGLNLDTHLTGAQAERVIASGLASMRASHHAEKPKMATIHPLPSRSAESRHIAA